MLRLIRPFISSVYFLFNFRTIKIFVALFSETVRPIKLKLNTHVDIGWMYRAYRNQTAAFHLSLGTLVDNGWMYRVYQIQAAAAYLSLYFFIFLSNYQTFTIFVTFFSGTVRPRKLKLGTHVDNEYMYRVYRN